MPLRTLGSESEASKAGIHMNPGPGRKRLRAVLAIAALGLAVITCGRDSGSVDPGAAQIESPVIATSTPEPSPAFKAGSTAYGFFPTPPIATIEGVLSHFEVLGEHGDFVLIQPNIPWADFVAGVEGESQRRTDIRNQVALARANDLGYVFVVDPLNGLNRREFFGLPDGWEPGFGREDIRRAFTNFTLWIVAEFSPRYLGLASEINTYADAHPEDFPNFISLYEQTYEQVKAEAPETAIFVTFQWDDLNNMFPGAAEGRPAGQTNWDQVEAFEPRLDIWAISSYPYFVFPAGDEIPSDYYTPLSSRTSKPLAVAEGGYASRDLGPIRASPEDQLAYLNAIHDQIGGRLDFWVYLLLDDLDMASISEVMRDEGREESDIEGLRMFSPIGLRESDGTPKPALEAWERFRAED